MNVNKVLLPWTPGSTIMLNHELVEELHKPIIRKFEKAKYTYLLKKICGVPIVQIRN